MVGNGRNAAGSVAAVEKGPGMKRTPMKQRSAPMRRKEGPTGELPEHPQ